MSKQWMRLDNAALIFPATRKKNWVNCFRVSAKLLEPIDPALLQQAVNDLRPRFPSLDVRLRAGVFWYYLEEIASPPAFILPASMTLALKSASCSSTARKVYEQARLTVPFPLLETKSNGTARSP